MVAPIDAFFFQSIANAIDLYVYSQQQQKSSLFFRFVELEKDVKKGFIVTFFRAPQLLMFEYIDQLDSENKHEEAYCLLAKQSLNTGLNQQEILWRLARSCVQLAYPLDMKNPKKKKLLDEGHKYACSAYELCSDDFNVLKWTAAAVGSRTDFLGTKERIEQGNFFRDVLDKALSINPEEYTLLHMRGRLVLSVASLSWIERKAATVLFGPPPEVSLDEAIRDFTAVLELAPDWLENTLFLAKAYLANGDRESAVHHLKQLIDSYQQNENDKDQPEALKEAKALLKKHGGK
ncbi:hypothetical protein niasHT_020451 [Heterodera trifolii]|uniref:Uncharacterized protein n=2 Tax=Heterodera trifolii TaxID=157864 RepID=A0ABD2JGG8_9BILA